MNQLEGVVKRIEKYFGRRLPQKESIILVFCVLEEIIGSCTFSEDRKNRGA
jgi:hypothetical protein